MYNKRKHATHELLERFFRLHGIEVDWCNGCYNESYLDITDINDRWECITNCGINDAFRELQVKRNK